MDQPTDSIQDLVLQVVGELGFAKLTKAHSSISLAASQAAMSCRFPSKSYVASGEKGDRSDFIEFSLDFRFSRVASLYSASL
jgi:hypothetical protein